MHQLTLSKNVESAFILQDFRIGRELHQHLSSFDKAVLSSVEYLARLVLPLGHDEEKGEFISTYSIMG